MKINQKGHISFIEIIVIIAIIAIIGGIGYIWTQKNKTEELKTGTQPKVTDSVSEPESKDCGTDFDCFISATNNCGLAKVTHTITLELFGVKTTNTEFLETRGIKSGKCSLYIQKKNIDMVFPADFPQATIDMIKTASQKMIGQDGICLFPNSVDLTNLLNRWKQGKFSFSTNPKEGDFKDADCSGKYFSQEVDGDLPANTSKTVKLGECSGIMRPIGDDGTACFSNEIDLGTVMGAKQNNKPVQCCKPK